jgi:hypothetical protein
VSAARIPGTVPAIAAAVPAAESKIKRGCPAGTAALLDFPGSSSVIRQIPYRSKHKKSGKAAAFPEISYFSLTMT